MRISDWSSDVCSSDLRSGGDDTIAGGGGSDLIFGQEGGDSIDGGLGDDAIFGGSGSDTLTGGGGADLFVWRDGDGNGETDTVTDFDSGEGDVLGLSGLLSGVAPGARSEEHPSELQSLR